MASGQNLFISLILRLRDDASKGLKDARERVRGLGQEVERLGPLDNAVRNTFLNIKAYILSAFAVAGIIRFTDKLVETIRVIQDLQTRLSGLTRSALDYAASQSYLVDLAGRYHKSVSGLTSAYASFLALENAGVITRQQSILLLQGFSNAATKTGASQDQMAQSTYGLTQALGTGIVAMEEFKQITEPMPGLANEIAKAFGLTVGQLRVLIGTGTVASDEFGRKFVQALKAYEGAAERAGGTISASYADIENAYNEMARALERPVASSVLDVIDLGKSTYGWIKDNSGAIVTALELIAVTLTGKVLNSLTAVTGGYAARYRAEASARASAIALAEADTALAAGNAELAASNLALVQSDLRAEAAKLGQANATLAAARAQVAALQATVQTTSVTYLLRNAVLQLTAAESKRSALLANMAALGRQQAAITAQITAAKTAQAEAELALANATNTSTVAMGRAAAAGRAAFAFIGGWVGVAVVALYGMYKALEKFTGAEEKAAIKAKALADAVALSTAEVKKLSESEVDIDFAKTGANIDAVNEKIREIESFNFGKLFNLSDLSEQRAHLLQTLDVLKQRKEALVDQKNDQIINFDASALSAAELTAALDETKAKIAEITDRVEPLKQQVADGLIGSEAINADLLLLNAYETKLSALQAATGTGAQLSQQQMKKAFKEAQDAANELTASIDAEAKAQTAAIQQSLDERLAAIDAMNISEAEKDNLRVAAKLQSYQLELDLQTQAGNAKLALIDQEYQAELAHAADNAKRTAEIETQKRRAKLSVYSGLAEYYQGEVARLGQVYASEHQAAQQAKQQLQDLNRSHEQALFDISLMGLSDREKLSEREYRFSQKMRDLRMELAKGDQGDQTKINNLLEDARKLHGEITTTAGEGSSQRYEAERRETELYKAKNEALQRNADAYQASAERAKKAQAEVAETLADTQTAITDITTKLNQDYALKIGVDEASLTAIRETIAELTRPETKTITIQTVNGVAPAQATGGPAGQPSGQPWRFNAGGYTPRSGKLPGFGGGDKIRALLEAGEFIVRKEAVAKLGLPFMQSVNAGQLPTGGEVIKRARGGAVGFDMDEELKKLKAAREQAAVSDLIANARAIGALGRTQVGTSSTIATMKRIGDQLRKLGRGDLSSRVSEIVSLGNVKTGDLAGQRDRIDLLKNRLFAAPTAVQVPEIQTPKLNIPMPTIPALSPAALQPAAAPAASTLRVQFVSPTGASVTGTFNHGDGPDLLRTLKDAGAITV